MRNGFRVAGALEQLGRLGRLPALRLEQAEEETFRICRTGRIQTFYTCSRCLLPPRRLRLFRRPPSSLTRFVAANLIRGRASRPPVVAANLIRGRALLYAARLPRPPKSRRTGVSPAGNRRTGVSPVCPARSGVGVSPAGCSRESYSRAVAAVRRPFTPPTGMRRTGVSPAGNRRTGVSPVYPDRSGAGVPPAGCSRESYSRAGAAVRRPFTPTLRSGPSTPAPGSCSRPGGCGCSGGHHHH